MSHVPTAWFARNPLANSCCLIKGANNPLMFIGTKYQAAEYAPDSFPVALSGRCDYRYRWPRLAYPLGAP